MNNYVTSHHTQYASGMHVSEVILTAPNYGTISLILRYPNSLHIKSVEQCDFYEDFMNFQGQPVKESTIAELKYLKNRIKNYIETNNLYFEFKIPPSNEDSDTLFPIIEIKGV